MVGYDPAIEIGIVLKFDPSRSVIDSRRVGVEETASLGDSRSRSHGGELSALRI